MAISQTRYFTEFIGAIQMLDVYVRRTVTKCK